jgi:hypothetical protein
MSQIRRGEGPSSWGAGRRPLDGQAQGEVVDTGGAWTGGTANFVSNFQAKLLNRNL